MLLQFASNGVRISNYYLGLIVYRYLILSNQEGKSNAHAVLFRAWSSTHNTDLLLLIESYTKENRNILDNFADHFIFSQ